MNAGKKKGRERIGGKMNWRRRQQREVDVAAGNRILEDRKKEGKKERRKERRKER